MKERIDAWGKELKKIVARERGTEELKPGEYIHVMGADSSILELVLERETSTHRAFYARGAYTRIVYSTRASSEKPFVFIHLESTEYADKPKQEFHDSVTKDGLAKSDPEFRPFAPECLSATEVEKRLLLWRDHM